MSEMTKTFTAPRLLRRRVGRAREARRERRHATAVDGDVLAADQLRDPLLQRMRTVSVGVERPVVCPAGREHPRVLAGAVVPELALGPPFLQAVLEVVDSGC